MKGNPSCGCNDSNICPPLPTCEKASVKRSNPCFSKTSKKTVPIISRVLADLQLSVLVEADITLPTPAMEIKSIRKNVSLKQCTVVPTFSTLSPCSKERMVNLFITGVVHKNIQYVEDCSGYIQHFSVEVPFSCNQQVPVVVPPSFLFSEKTRSEELLFQDQGLGGDRCQFGMRTFEDFNEPIECKLMSAGTLQLDLLKDFDKSGRFKKVTEKMEIVLSLKLLQKQLDFRQGERISVFAQDEDNTQSNEENIYYHSYEGDSYGQQDLRAEISQLQDIMSEMMYRIESLEK